MSLLQMFLVPEGMAPVPHPLPGAERAAGWRGVGTVRKAEGAR